MNGTKSSGISVEVLPNGIHVLPPGHHIRHPYHHTCKLCGTETAHMYACFRDAGSAGMCVCYITPAILYVKIAQTNRNAWYSCVGSVCMSVILVPDQQPSHYCHRVSRHLCHYACLIMWNRPSTHV